MKSKLINFLREGQSFIEKQGIERITFTLICLLLILVLVGGVHYIFQLYEAKSQLEQRKAQLRAELSTLEDAEKYEVRKMSVTKYAPLDEAAIEGWDYEGDRHITASGDEVVPGKTAAAGPNISFGTRIYVEGKGWYTVKDRGGGIGVGDIDLATESKERSQEWGIQEKLVIIENH